MSTARPRRIALVAGETSGDALGAEVMLTVATRTIMRSVRSAYSYLASNDPRVHVGLGTATGVVNVRVRWPDGTLERFGDFAADQIVTLQRHPGRR